MSEKDALLPICHHDFTTTRSRSTLISNPWRPNIAALVILGVLFSSTLFLFPSAPDSFENKGQQRGLRLKDIPKHLRNFQDCSIDRFISETELDFLTNAQPLPMSEFVHRRHRLAKALLNEGIDAFAVEPGPTFQYYANLSQNAWGRSERPFVMVIQPEKVNETVKARTSFLVPSFEAGRARLLRMAFEQTIDFITYEEHWNYYSTLRDSTSFANFEKNPKLMVDGEMRDFISRGLNAHGFDVVGLGGDVERVRQIKSPAEIEIMRAANTGTVEALRAMQRCLEPALTETDVRAVLENTLRAGGLDPTFPLVLFDEDASNPHGGTDGKKKLANETMVLIDVGAQLYGYSSDVTRSFFPPFLRRHPVQAENSDIMEKLVVWGIVYDAQTASMQQMHQGSTAAAVDIAARELIESFGYGSAFTHRLGHGIGLQGHETPYMNKANVNTTLKAGMTITSEPGIYLVDKFGVRLEDVVMVREDGFPDILSGRRAIDPWQP